MKKIALFLGLIVLASCSKKVDIAYNGGGGGGAAPAPTYPMQLNKNLPANGNVNEAFQATGDGTRVVYIADEDADGINELFITNVITGAKLKLSPTLPMGRNVTAFKLSPNSTKVAYLADHNSAGRKDLFTVNLDASQFNQVNLNLPSNAHSVGAFDWLPNSSKLVYTSDEEASVGNYGLFIANPNGSNRLTLNAGPVGANFGIAPNNSRIVYRLGIANPNLRSIIPDGTGDALLNLPFDLINQPASGISGFIIAPNSTKVVYRSNQENDIQYELFSVNLDGSGTHDQLNNSMVAGANIGVTPGKDFLFSADSSRVAYLADADTNGVNELYVKILGGLHVKLNGPLVGGGNVNEVQFVTNTSVAYLADENLNNVQELFTVNTDGSNHQQVNSNLSIGETVAQFKVSPAGNLLAYVMDIGNSGIYGLYTNTPDGLNENLMSGGLSVGATGAYDSAYNLSPQFKFSSNNRLVFAASLGSSLKQMYSLQLSGAGFKQVSANAGNIELNSTALGSSFLVLDNGLVVYRQDNGSNINLIGNYY